MSVDFAARALAQRAGQARSFTTLATGLPAVSVPSGVSVIRTSGYDAEGTGAGSYVSDALATAALAAAHPRFCKTDAGGRHWRLLPDDNGLIPVSCGGANGFAGHINTQVYTGVAMFSTAPWSPNGTLTDGAAGPPGSTGNGTLFTATGGGNYQVVQMPLTRNVEIAIRVKGATASHIFINCETPADKGLWIDATTGAITYDGFGNVAVTALGGGWFDIRLTTAIAGYLRVGSANGSGSTHSNAGDSFHLFDVQLTDGVAVTAASTTNDQPAVQGAIAYSEAIGAAGVRFDAPAYSLWRTQRNLAAVNDAHADKSGLLLMTTKSQAFISTCPQTVLYRRDVDGSAMGIAKFTICTGSGGYYWRGGGIFTEGQTTAPADPGENSILLHNVMLDGGIYDSSEQANPYGANMHSSGDGWDVTDKGIWQSNDRYCGHIVMEGRSGIRYFMGELIYGSGVGASIADREIRIGPDVDLGHTCGSCLNGNGQTLKVERCRLHHAYLGIEGWTGHLGGYLKARISHTTRNSLQGGIPNFGSGNYFLKARPGASVVPIGQVDLVLHKCEQFDIGSWLQGKIVAIDCIPSLGNGAAFAGGSQDIDLDVTTYADQSPMLGGIAILGGAPGTMTTDRVSIRLTCKRTDRAKASGHKFSQAVYHYGSFGPEVTVHAVSLEGMERSPASPAATIHDYAIKLLGWSYDAFAAPNFYYDIEANNGAVCDIRAYGNVIATLCSSNGSYAMNLPTTGVPAGYRLFVRDTTRNFVAGGGACRIPAGNFRAGGELIIPPGYGYAELEFDGQAWAVVSPPPKLSATAGWGPGNIPAGATATTSVALIGAVPGDEVSAGFSGSLAGMVLTAYVSAANTVTAMLFNPAGAAVDLAGGTLRVTAR